MGAPTPRGRRDPLAIVAGGAPPTVPLDAAHRHAQRARRELAQARERARFARDLFEGWVSREAAEAIREAELEVEGARRALGEWVV